MVGELKLDFGSHLNAHVQGWDFAAEYGEVIDLLLANAVMNALVKEGSPPVQLPTPWPQTPKADEVTPEELVVLRAKLRESSVFAN